MAGDSVLHNLKPETKIIAALFLLIGAGIGNIWALALVGLLSVLGVLVARVPVKEIFHVILLVFIRLLTNLLPGLHLLDVASLEIVTSLFRDDCNSNSTAIGRTLPIAIFLDEQG